MDPLKGRLKQILRKIEQKTVQEQGTMLNPQAIVFNPSTMILPLET